jgi:leucyl/phenylalanyl-tRNA--protein transferase
MSTGGEHDGVWVEPLESVEGMLAMYRGGWFPMAGVKPGEPEGIEWVQPRQRWLIGLHEDVEPRLQMWGGGVLVGKPLHVPRRLKTRLRTHKFELRVDTAFERVIRECAALRKGEGEESRWLTEPIIRAFVMMHESGYAHCVEAWLKDEGGERLVGGIYGLAVGRIFCAESMFSRPECGGTDASKVCLVMLARMLNERGFMVMDAQMRNEHTAQFGGFEVSAEEYVKVLSAGMEK